MLGLRCVGDHVFHCTTDCSPSEAAEDGISVRLANDIWAYARTWLRQK